MENKQRKVTNMSETLRLEHLLLSALTPAQRNPKNHALPALRDSIGRFGYVEPIVLDERTGRLVAGHGRAKALSLMKAKGGKPLAGVAEKDGEWLVPVMRGWASRSDQEAEAYLLASNQLTVAGGWDEGPLAELVRELADAQALEGTGFDAEALEKLLGEAAGTNGNTDPDEVPEERPTDIKLGDMFRLGDHLLMCGDSTKAEDVDRLMGGALADICWTDPPWNVNYTGKTKAKLKIANDNLGSAFPAFCTDFSEQIVRVLKPGGLVYLAMSTSEWAVIDTTLKASGLKWSTTIIWAKDSLVLSRKDYHPQYEPLWYGWKDGAARLCPLEDRTQSDLWSIPRPKRSEEHPTMKPVELVARALANSSKPGALCFEPFSGSGTTLLACEKMGRACRAIELGPKYVQVAIDRWEAFTGRKAEKVQDSATPAN